MSSTQELPWQRLERRLCEAFDELFDGAVDPCEPYYDGDGRWLRLGEGGAAPLDEGRLASLRGECRALAVGNEFAINGHENRVNFIVGSGHAYHVVARKNRAPGEAEIAAVQELLDAFCEENQWHKRQQEIVRRKDRDGECFLRLFGDAEGMTRVRFVEPDQVAAPPGRQGEGRFRFGIETLAGDVETAVAYWIDGEPVAAAAIQHRKANVDANVKRGLPLYLPVRKNLRRAEKLLRNMSVVAEIQSAIAIIRRHASATAAGLERFVRQSADAATVQAGSGRTTHFKRYAPGTILDASAGTEYQFPAAGIDAGRYVAVLQAELRAIASRLVMPEFMLTSDASNANYASTMVAEGPAVKMFERLQHEMIEDDLELLRRVLRHAEAAGRLPHGAADEVEIRAAAPKLAVRDRLQDARADEILVRNGAMSIATMALRHGLDPEHERRMREDGGALKNVD